FGIPPEKFHIVPLGIDVQGFPDPSNGDSQVRAVAETAAIRPLSIGYFARICPAKGFDLLVDAFLVLKQQPGMNDITLHAGGWLGESDRKFYEQQLAKLERAGAAKDFKYHGSLDRDAKIAFLRNIDVFSVPSNYREPKGLYVLESLAAGIPVVQPEHGAFP